jgi:sulfate permease, SulP family
MKSVPRLFPFLAWFPPSAPELRRDALAGLTVAMILIPQSMAYAQLAGLPAYYGLYAAFLPVIVGALWGSSHQLSTGPVAMVSLLTGSTLAAFAAPGSDVFIALAIVLALIVGLLQIAMGAFRLGAIISFLSHPVIVGFTNAAAIIIALSQLNKLLGLPIARTDIFLRDVWEMLQQLREVHLPTLAMGLAALGIMLALRRYRPQLPAVLIAVVLTTLVSWAAGFERKETAHPGQFADPTVSNIIYSLQGMSSRVEELHAEILIKQDDLQKYSDVPGFVHPRVLALRYDIEVLRLDLATLERELRLRLRELRRFTLERVAGEDSPPRYYLAGDPPPEARTDGRIWRISRIIEGGGVVLSGGGEVVGHVPAGLPSVRIPAMDWNMVVMLFSSAFVITLVGFMEAISIAKAMATRTKQRIDPNQELIGQGLANVAGSFTQAFPVSGSFSRTAVNVTAGAATGMSSVVAGGIVLLTLLLFTRLLHHLPDATLAAIIMLAVAGLVNFRAMKHAWDAHRHDGVAALVTFAATLGFAPHLDTGILAGAALAIVLYLYRTMRPRVAVLGRHPDGTLRDALLHDLPTSEHIIVVRFDGSLFFANVPYFEDTVLEQAAKNPKAKFLLVVADGVNEIDGSGEEVIRHLVERLQESGVTMVLSGVKMQVLRVMERTGLYSVIGAQNFFRTEDAALEAIYQWVEDPDFDAKFCPLTLERAEPQEDAESVARVPLR